MAGPGHPAMGQKDEVPILPPLAAFGCRPSHKVVTLGEVALCTWAIPEGADS